MTQHGDRIMHQITTGLWIILAAVIATIIVLIVVGQWRRRAERRDEASTIQPTGRIAEQDVSAELVDPYEQLVATHQAMNDIEERLRTALDDVWGDFLSGHETQAVETAAEVIVASSRSWRAGTEDVALLDDIVMPLNPTPWTRGDLFVSTTGRGWPAQRRFARKVLKERTMTLPVIELLNAYREEATV